MAYEIEKWSSVVIPATFVLFCVIYYATYLGYDDEISAEGYKLVPIKAYKDNSN